MALENSESLSDTRPISDTLERVPDSAPVQVNPNPAFESGTPPARVRHDLRVDSGLEYIQSALAIVTRTEANLGLLVRGLKHLASGTLAARAANTELIHELEALRTCLSRSHEQEHALRSRMNQLQQLLDVIRYESARERVFLTEQQDLFLVELLNDHDRQVADLRRQLSARGPHQLTDGTASDAAAREIEELRLQRDQARDYASRCERERDAAWHELATSAEPSAALRQSTPPEAFNTLTRMTSGGLAIGSISLRAAALPASGRAGTEQPAATHYSLSGSGEDIAE